MDTEIKTVYTAMCADVFHIRYLRIILQAAKLGQLTIGLLTDSAILEYKGYLPLIHYENRLEIVQNIKGVHKVIPQDGKDWVPNLLVLKPNIVVRGVDWRQTQPHTRQQVEDAIKQWNGALVEIEDTADVSSTCLKYF